MYRINIQYAVEKKDIPSAVLLRTWAKQALKKKIASAEITIRLVNLKEMTYLNETYRHKNGPTNVLSFPFLLPKEIPISIPILGDIVVCVEVVNREAETQKKLLKAHWAHMIIHGVFHLLGFDHETDIEAIEMEKLEIDTLQTLGFSNPYLK
jgi:probable rRNA maturation factor